ncbi:1-aminocyclopropane-1-carboxylate deaminase/D-cysteine desulfhydrase [Acinetobacter qingfengensis]|uniref:1-aminocyclopropane-1-carboxylate deaminase n=1 Tax=Acinetobacter qingfengensis TaxID=1262585 RepID=A0A1E7RDQ2_9GAMM|nr:pyridoxal-phosphate dependent enzyme [Acinetobacter qingfengensis]KAA8734445.1 1-aminocyclopropane-1-carboxylate deaminase/D-cysteine desulfhydrase [Acinetobacter qingfengensis]OEY97357.1 1-aminocyclopropane-1-carboxylate deaminase [Acinetobacter qingfengensis]
MFNSSDVPYQTIMLTHDISVTIKRIDLIHPKISGNKFFKLKYNFFEAQRLGYQKLLSFGGAYSNHIFALAHAAKTYGFQSIGIIRGDELADRALNPILQQAQHLGMQLHFVTRTEYRKRHEAEYLKQLQHQFPNSYIIPEGGTNTLAVQGCQEILNDTDLQNFDVICCAVGTGGTISGLINASSAQQKILGFSALKGNFLDHDIRKWTKKNNWSIIDSYCCGGYAKTTTELLNFIKDFKQDYSIPLEPIYTGKMMMGISDLIQQNYFPPNTRILVIHSGGLQGK